MCLILLMLDSRAPFAVFFFFFNDTATTEIYTLSLHDALPICKACGVREASGRIRVWARPASGKSPAGRAHAKLFRAADRKSTRLNSSHGYISYAVFCLKKKKNTKKKINDYNKKVL